MAGIALSGVGKILSIGLAIKDAVGTDRRNMKEFRGIVTCVDRVYSILGCVREKTHLIQHPVMNDTMDDLANSLEEALDLINDCQGRNAIARLLKAGSTAKELRRVKDDIDQKLLVGMFAGMVQIFTFTATIQDPQGCRNTQWLICLELSQIKFLVQELEKHLATNPHELVEKINYLVERSITLIIWEKQKLVGGTNHEPRIVDEPIRGTDSGPPPFVRETHLISAQAQHPERDDDNGCHSSNSKGPSAAIIVPEGHKTLPRRPIRLQIKAQYRWL